MPTLQEALHKRNLTQREVARRLGVTESYISLLVHHRKRWSISMTRAFSFATGIPIATIRAANGERKAEA